MIATFSDMDDGTSHFNGKIPIHAGQLRRLLQDQQGHPRAKEAHNKLLTSICNAMDLPVTGIGAPQYAGTLPGLAKV